MIVNDNFCLQKEVSFEGYQNNKLKGAIYRPDDEMIYPGIVFFHGLQTDSREFMGFPENLAKMGNTVFVFDYSGHGKSEGQQALFTKESHYHDSINAVEKLILEGVSSVAVLGHSLGAYAALLMLKEVRKIERGIIISPQIKSGDSLSMLKRIMLAGVGSMYNFFGSHLTDICFQTKVDYAENYLDPDAAKRAQAIGFLSPQISLRFASYAMQINNAELAKAVEKPVLFVISKEDKNVLPNNSKFVFHQIKSKQKRLLLLKRSGHSPFADFDKDLLVNEINHFLKTTN